MTYEEKTGYINLEEIEVQADEVVEVSAGFGTSLCLPCPGCKVFDFN